MNIYIRGPRKDQKFKVLYCFDNGRKINKIRTKDEVVAEINRRRPGDGICDYTGMFSKDIFKGAT